MFNLDVEAAKTAESNGNRINESGIYTGTITRAEWSKSQTSQAEFFNVDFKGDDGKEASYMSICFKKGDGTNSFGYNIMNKIMACTGQRSLNKVPMGEKITCPELTNARVSFALQAEHDWYQDKNTGEWKPTVNMVISTPFKADTGQSAKEVLEQLPAEAIKTTVVNDRKPKEKPVDNLAPQQSVAPQMAPAYDPNGPQSYGTKAADDSFDDIPF